MAILGLWFAWSIATITDYGHANTVVFISQPFNAVMLMLLCVTMAYHSYLGVQVVIEDYIHSHGLKLLSLVLSRFAHIFLAAVGLFAILRLATGA